MRIINTHTATALTGAAFLLLSTLAQAESQWVRFHIPGMSCQGCSLQLRRELKKVPGVQKVQVNQNKEEIKIIYDAETTHLEDLEVAIAITGFAGQLSDSSH